jgi:hypothetical protein
VRPEQPKAHEMQPRVSMSDLIERLMPFGQR